MAQTGKRFVPITPAWAVAGIPPSLGSGFLEASAQTYGAGAVLQRSSGYIQEAASSAIPTLICGFAHQPGQNGATDGAKTPNFYRAEIGRVYTATFNGTLSQTHMGANAMLTYLSSSWCIAIVTSLSASYNCRIDSWTSRWATGDVYPEVQFTLLASVIQTNN